MPIARASRAGTTIATAGAMTTLDLAQLATIHGGMKLDGFRRSDNIEDRRPPEAVAEDTQWMSAHRAAPVGADSTSSPRDAQLGAASRPRLDVLQPSSAR
jgi:hypothetical protein